MTNRLSLIATLFACLSLTAFSAEKPYYRAELIFPLQSKHCHSSSIVETPDGDLLSCWYIGSGERSADDLKIQGARLKAGEKQWTTPFLMADTPKYPDVNPVLFLDSTRKLWLFYGTVLNNQWAGTLLKVRTSRHYEDLEGPPKWNWQDVVHVTPVNYHKYFLAGLASRPEILRGYDEREGDFDEILTKLRDKLATRLGWFMRCQPLEIPEENKIIVPLYSDLWDQSIMIWTQDSGRTWTTGTPIVGYGDVQPSLVRKSDGTLVAMMRDNGGFGFMQISESKDEGNTWSPAKLSKIPNPGSSVCVIRLHSGEWLLVYNDTQRGRHSLLAALSDDEGKTWRWKRHLAQSPRKNASYAYPTVIQDRKGMIHVTYSYSQKKNGEHEGGQSIRHAAFDTAWVKAGDSN